MRSTRNWSWGLGGGAAAALIAIVGASPAGAQIVDTRVPLNYNFHGMAHSAAITGGVDEWTAVATNANGDLVNGYRSLADRGLIFDPANNHSPAFYSGANIGATGLSYAFFNTLGYSNTTATDPALNGLDIVHLGARCTGFAPATIFAYEAAVNAATNVGTQPAWDTCNHTGAQTTTFAPIALDAGAEIGVLYNNPGAGQFDVVLGFTDHSPITVRVAGIDWFGASANPAILANQLVSSQAKLVHNVGGTNYNSFQGADNNDAPVIKAFLTSGAGPNLNIVEAVIGVPKIVTGAGTTPADPTIVGAHLNSITFQNALYPASGGRGYAIFASTVRTGQPTRANCATPDVVVAGDNASNNIHTFGATPSGYGTNDTSAVWYAYTATGTNTVEVRTCGAAFDTTLAVYPSCGGSAVAGNDNGCGSASRLQFQAVSGNTYLIRVAGNSGATGNFTLHIDDPAHVDITMPIQFNWNGICHGASEQTLPSAGTTPPIGSTHENRSDLNGFRAIADRGLLCDGIQTDALNFGGTVGFQGILYQVYATAMQSDMVHLGDRSLAAGGIRNWSPLGTSWPSTGGTATSNNGLRPVWLNQDSQPSSTSSMSSLNAVFGPNTRVALLYHMSNVDLLSGTTPRPAYFDVTLGFTDATSVTVSVFATDWFGTNTQVMPAAGAGLEVQRVLGIYRGVQNTDKGDDAGTGGRLKVDEAVISRSTLQAAGFDPLGKTLASITFGNLHSGNAAQDAIYSAVGIYAATLRDPASFNLNFGPGGVGTVTPNQLRVGATGRMTVSVSRGSGSPNNITAVSVDGSSIGLGTLTLNDSGTGGDQNPNDNVWSRNVTFPVNTTAGTATLPFTVTDAQARTAGGNIIFSILAPSGSVTPNPVLAGNVGTATVTLSPNTGAATDITSVLVDGAPLGITNFNLNDSASDGDATANDGIWSGTFTVPANALGGPVSLSVTATDTLARTGVGTLNFSVVGPPVAVDLGTLTTGIVHHNDSLAAGEIRWLKFTLSAPVDAGSLNFLDIDTEGSAMTPTNDTELGLYDATGNRIADDDDDGTGLLTQLTFGSANPPRPAPGDGAAYNGRDGAVLPAGTYYLAYSGFNSTFANTLWGVTSASTYSGAVSVNLALGTVPAGGPPAVYTDLGAIGATPVTSTQPLSAGGVQWFRFDVPAIDGANPTRTYFDVDTEGSTISDTVIGLFRDDGSGTLVKTDDNDGSGSWSQLTYGRGTRPAPGDGVAYDGRDGVTLAAGTYYLAVTEASATFGTNFIVFFNTGTSTGNVTVNLRTGFQSPILTGPITSPLNGNQYYLLDTGFNFNDAEAFAVTLDGHLASMNDFDENEWVRANVLLYDGATARRAWIGLFDSAFSPTNGSQVWNWTDASTFSFTNWSAGEPSDSGGTEFYVEMFANGLWNDIGLAGATTGGDYALIERPAPCQADFNHSGSVSVQDIFDFLSAYFTANPAADVNHSGAVTVQDIFDYLMLYFTGCP